MNDQFSGYDLNFGLDRFAPRQVQQQQAQQQHRFINSASTNNHNSLSNGPCMDNYDPSRVLIQGTNNVSPYNSNTTLGGQHSQGNSSNICNRTSRGFVRDNQQNNTHQILMPSRRNTDSSLTNSHINHRQGGQNHQQIHHQILNRQQQQRRIHQHRQNPQIDFTDFEPIPIAKNGAVGRGMAQQIRQSHPQPSSQDKNNPKSSTLDECQSEQRHYKQKQTRQTARINANNILFDGSASVNDFFSMPSHSSQQNQQPINKQQEREQHRLNRNPKKEEWLENLKIEVPGVSLESMSGSQILRRMKERSDEVSTRYLPCVDFLVQCQQELRKGLQVATTKRYVHHMFRDTLTPREFHTQYIAQLPERFYRKNKRVMTSENLTEAYKELQRLVGNAKGVQSQGCEVVKNTFLGGMKDGESWGLRKWLSKHGGALHICNDMECLSTSCQKLDRELETTRKLAERLRPLASAALKKLKADVPSSYQEQSSAHPYLPFFHRLECALRGMSNFDPEDDDVICIIDDDEVEELKAKAKATPPASKSRKRIRKCEEHSTKSKIPDAGPTANIRRNRSSRISEENDSDIEILEQKPLAKRSRARKPQIEAKIIATKGYEKTKNVDQIVNEFGIDAEADDSADDSDMMEELLKTLDDDDNDDTINFEALDRNIVTKDNVSGCSAIQIFGACELADGLDSLATLFDTNQHAQVRPTYIKPENLWDEGWPFASALRLFSEILRSPECTTTFLDSVDEDEMIQEGKLPYTEIVKHPLCFRDICSALFIDYDQNNNSIEGANGALPFGTTLSAWNMWKGKELLQAIDLVFLNSLAYGKANGGGSRCSLRSRTNKLRKVLWSGIKDVIDASFGKEGNVEERRKCTPTRRGESSGFVIHKVTMGL